MTSSQVTSLFHHQLPLHLSRLTAIVERLESLPDVTHVLKRFTSPDGACVEVDVTCNHGYTWVKVIARKAEALHRVWAGITTCQTPQTVFF